MLKVAGLYATFAVVSIAINIGTQVASMAVYSGTHAVPLSLAAGTLTGLIAKYLLDKRWIFAHTSRNVIHEARIFLMYGLMGVLTTTLFWGTELAFHVLFHNDTMRYLGGVLGLAVGYAAKYLLDRRFVFI